MAKAKTSLETIVLNIYEAAQSSEQWQDVAKICDNNILHGTFEIVCFDKTATKPIITIMDDASKDIQTEFLSSLIENDKRVPYLWENNINQLISWHELSDHNELKGNDEFNLFAKRVDMEIITSANLSIGDQKCYFTNARSINSPIQDSESFKALELLMPHMRKAIRLQLAMQSLQTNHNLLAQSWDTKNTAIIFLKKNYDILFANAFAEDLLSRNFYKIIKQRLQFTNTGINQVFHKCLFSLKDKDQLYLSKQDSFLVQDESGNEYGVRLMPYFGDVSELNISATSLIMIMITPLTGSSSTTSEDVHRFGQLYGLTLAEEQILYALINEIELSDLAKSKNIKIDTARKQLKSVLQKTGLKNQKQLVRLIDRFCFLNLK